MDSIVVVGLGNPGAEYEGTRHNIGYEVVDELARRFRIRLKAGRSEYMAASHQVRGRAFVLAKPLTYMNNSGNAVIELLAELDAPLQHLIVIADDLALPLGTVRVRAKGSDGGHNGLCSIIYQLNSDKFARVRCGIRQEVRPRADAMSEFVLSTFDREERNVVGAMIVRAADAAIEFAHAGIAYTMNKFNTRL